LASASGDRAAAAPTTAERISAAYLFKNTVITVRKTAPKEASMPDTLIQNAAWAVVWDGARHVYRRDVDLLLRGDRVESVAPHAPAAPPPADAGVVDGRRLMAMPGLVNVHTHPTTEPGFRGVREDHGVAEQQMSGLFERSQAMRPRRGRTTGGNASGLCGADVGGRHQRGRSFCPVPRLDGRHARKRLRASGPVPGSRPRAGGMSAPQTVTWEWDRAAGRRGFQRSQAIMVEAEADPSGRLSGIVFPAQIDTVEEDLLRDAAALAAETGRAFTTHIAQAVVEVREMIRRHGTTPIQWAAGLGLLGPRSILGHAIFTDDHPSISWHTARDVALVAERGAAVAHCPSPFARYGEHLKHFGRYAGAGVRMALGTDVAPHNLIEEIAPRAGPGAQTRRATSAPRTHRLCSTPARWAAPMPWAGRTSAGSHPAPRRTWCWWTSPTR
jgi:cytosine/adenosine deaminase-related metal-dependent hydrolase